MTKQHKSSLFWGRILEVVIDLVHTVISNFSNFLRNIASNVPTDKQIRVLKEKEKFINSSENQIMPEKESSYSEILAQLWCSSSKDKLREPPCRLWTKQDDDISVFESPNEHDENERSKLKF